MGRRLRRTWGGDAAFRERAQQPANATNVDSCRSPVLKRACTLVIEIFGSTWWVDHLMLGVGVASFLYMLITR